MIAAQNPRKNKRRPGRVGIVLLLLSIVTGTGEAQHSATNPGLRPVIPEAGAFRSVVGLSFTVPSREIVGEIVTVVPMAELEMSCSLPKGFSLHADAASVYLINRVSLGGGWSAGGEDLTVTVGGTMTWWFGVAKMEGFDASARGSHVTPWVEISYRHAECVARLKADIRMNTAQQSSIGGADISRNDHRIAGASLKASLEHTFSRSVTLILGARLNVARPGYETWMAFPATDKWMTYPTFSVGYVL